MVTYFLPSMILLFFYFVFNMYFIFTKKKKWSWEKELLNILFFLYIIAVINVTLLPLPVDSRLIANNITNGYAELNNFLPFHSINETINNPIGWKIAAIQIGGNILIGVPFGFFAPLIFKKINKLPRIFIAGILFSLSIECTQKILSFIIGFSYRSFDVDDIILNSSGVLIGYMSLKICIPLISSVVSINHLKYAQRNN